MTDAPERIWATPFDPEVMEGGTYCDAAARPTAPNHDAWCYIRADLSSPLGAVAMRDAAISAIDADGEYVRAIGLSSRIRAIPLPTHADMLAAALKLPEVAAMREALERIKQDAGGWPYDTACDALAALEARHE